jgi:hypothetical protein
MIHICTCCTIHTHPYPAGPLGPVVRYNDDKIDDTGLTLTLTSLPKPGVVWDKNWYVSFQVDSSDVRLLTRLDAGLPREDTLTFYFVHDGDDGSCPGCRWRKDSFLFSFIVAYCFRSPLLATPLLSEHLLCLLSLFLSFFAFIFYSSLGNLTK